ncbi:hypothetical protein [Kluyvera ascorbata]|uniref:hypothetical protein n=1 Tax=Kluyvera ascorbata TaxID=51288 RepID=UPI0039F67B2A
MRFVIRDPKKASIGSFFRPPARSGPKTQDVPFHQLMFCLYVVFSSFCVTRRSPS